MERLNWKDFILFLLVCSVWYLYKSDIQENAYLQGYDDAIAEENVYACELRT